MMADYVVSANHIFTNVINWRIAIGKIVIVQSINTYFDTNFTISADNETD
jgi:hypothetical protein